MRINRILPAALTLLLAAAGQAAAAPPIRVEPAAAVYQFATLATPGSAAA